MDDQALRDYFEFDEFDLAANRNGELSEKQKQKLLKGKREEKSFDLKVGVPALVIAAMLVFVSIAFFNQLGSAVCGTLILMLVLGVVACFFLYGAFIVNKGDLSKDIVKKAEGPIRILSTRSYGSYDLRVGGMEFAIEEKLVDKFSDGDNCAVYYDESGESILSVERTSKK